MPLAQRLPKLGGFKNPFKKVYAVVNLTKLNRFQDGATVAAEDFYQAGLARPGSAVKLLGTGRLRRRLTLQDRILARLFALRTGNADAITCARAQPVNM